MDYDYASLPTQACRDWICRVMWGKSWTPLAFFEPVLQESITSIINAIAALILAFVALGNLLYRRQKLTMTACG